MKCLTPPSIVFQEVPNEISLSLAIAGCPLNCRGCFWKDIEMGNLDRSGVIASSDGVAQSGNLYPAIALTDSVFRELLLRYQHYISCVLFLGGEWHAQSLISYLSLARQSGLATCLYTGRPDVPHAIKEHLTYLKVGSYLAEQGGLDNPDTNQKLIDLRTGECLNRYFWK